MKKLGLIGGIGPESTIEYYRSIEYGVQKKSGQNFFPNITIESLNVFDVLNLCKNQDYDGLTDYLLNGINQLSAAGVQYAALTGITTHIVFDALSKVSPIPLVSMVDTASEFTKAHSYRKVCLLGTLPTMNGTFFSNLSNLKVSKSLHRMRQRKSILIEKLKQNWNLEKLYLILKTTFEQLQNESFKMRTLTQSYLDAQNSP